MNCATASGITSKMPFERSRLAAAIANPNATLRRGVCPAPFHPGINMMAAVEASINGRSEAT